MTAKRVYQSNLFPNGDDLPLFSGTVQRAKESVFAPAEVEIQPVIPELATAYQPNTRKSPVARQYPAAHSTAILRYPSGRHGIVGSVPVELTHVSPTSIFSVRVSNSWDTEAEAIAALLALGYTRFQLADCTWYNGE